MDYQLHRGDCLDVMPTLVEPVDMILADLPYGTTACAWDSVIPFEPLWAQYKRLIKPRGAVVLFGSQPFTSALVMSQPGWFKYAWVWEKDQGVNFQLVKHQPLKSHEDILIFSKDAHTYNPQGLVKCSIQKSNALKGGNLGHLASEAKRAVYLQQFSNYPRTVVSIGRETGLHPTQKPIALLEYLIRTYTNEGETVLDNTMGSGSTGVACMNTKRRFIGIELDPHYFAIAERRIADAARQARGEFRYVTDTQTHDDLPLFSGA